MSRASSGLSVLVVEDEVLISMAAVDTLRELSHTAKAASNAKAALAILQGAEVVDVMIVDINLPDMNGQQLAEEARRLRPGIPIVFATGYRMDVPENLALTGPTAVLGKPYWTKDLEKALGQVC
jgi:CheY-like chemotaxis protein